MKDKILSNTKKHVISVQSTPPFEEWDYLNYQPDKRNQLNEEWRKMNDVERSEYQNKIGRFYTEKGFFEPSSEQKSFKLIWEEGTKRLQPNLGFKTLAIDDHLQERAVLEFLEMIENTEQIQSIYKFKKKGVGDSKNSGINGDDAKIIKSCLLQGRELFESGRNSPMMVKPLIYFYSITAYAYSTIVLNSPIRYKLSMLNGSHGLHFIDKKSRVQFGGGISEGTFSDLFLSFPVINHIAPGIEILQDNRESIKEFWNAKYELSIGELLSMIPELRNYYKLVTGDNSRTHPLTIKRTDLPRSISWELAIGDGDVEPSMDDLRKAFGEFEVRNSRGMKLIEIPDSDTHKIRGTIFTDLYGGFWYIENPLFPVVLPEICVHFLLMSAFSNIMRYNPHDWSQILENETDSKVSLLIRKYISVFENKVPILLLRCLTDFHAVMSKR